MMNERFLLVLAGGAAVVWSVSRWRQAVRVAMILLILEGAVRKWVFPGAQDLVYFAKDVFFLGAYLGFLRQRNRIRFRPLPIPLLYGSLIAAALYGALEIFNPQLPNLLVGALGFKAYFFYVPLLFLVPAAFPSDGELARFLRRYALLAIPVGLLAVAQFFSSPTSFLNTYARPGEGEFFYATTFGSSTHVRVTATFSYITGYSSYLVATAVLVLGLLGVMGWRFRGNLFLFASLGMILLGMLTTGSRGPIVILVLLFPLYWWLAVSRERGGGATFGRILIGLILVGVVLGFTAGEALQAFYGRMLGSSDVPFRMVAPFLQPFYVFPESGLLGFGIGATHQTAAAVTPGLLPYSWTRGILVESETGRVMLELGAIGFLLVYFTRLFLAVYAFRQIGRLRTRFHRTLATMSFLFLLPQVLGGGVFEVVTGVYYWFFAGLLMAAIRLDQEAVRAAAARAAPAPAPAAADREPRPSVPVIPRVRPESPWSW